MVRKEHSGFSFVEVMISMVVLALVTLVIGVVLTTSISTHKASYSSDEAYAIAREKLAGLQDPNTTIEPAGSETAFRTNVVYTVYWEAIESANEPNQAVITVKWDNDKRSIQISGFIEASIEGCVDIENNTNPTNLQISPSSPQIAENSPVGTLVGTFSVDDPDVGNGDIITYELHPDEIYGVDNDEFTINGNKLQTLTTFSNTDTKKVRVRAYDCAKAVFLYLNVSIDIITSETNLPPVDITLSPDYNSDDHQGSINENEPANTVIGTFASNDPNQGQSHTYSFAGTYSDEGNFEIDNASKELKAKYQFDYENKNSYTIAVTSTDDGNPPKTTDPVVFIINVLDINEPPYNIRLSSTSLSENAGANAVIGTFETDDYDIGQNHFYTLVTGADYFNISGNSLRANASFDYETQSHSYVISVTSTDDHPSNPLTTDPPQDFTITILNVNDAPTAISLNPSDVDEGKPVGTTVGTFSATDQDAGQTHTYTLVSGTGDADNAMFTISGDELRTAVVFDYSQASTRHIRVQADDNEGGIFQQAFDITINQNPCAVYAPWYYDPWNPYQLGDKCTNGGSLWECIDIGQQHRKPSGPYGDNGWSKVMDCP